MSQSVIYMFMQCVCVRVRPNDDLLCLNASKPAYLPAWLHVLVFDWPLAFSFFAAIAQPVPRPVCLK